MNCCCPAWARGPIGEMAETAGEPLKKLAERQRDDRDYPIVYVDGIRFCGHHILATLCVDEEGDKRGSWSSGRRVLR